MKSKPINYSIPSPKIDFNPPIYVCKRAKKPFKLDGRIDKEFWEDASFTECFVDIEGDNMPKPRFKTQAKILWDDENLYFAARLIGNEIWGTIEERDAVIFYDNDFEIFIDPDSDTHRYYELEINAKNTVWDLFLTKPYRDGGVPINSWDIQGLQTAVYIDGELNNPKADNKEWSVEIVMPFKVLKECAENKQVPKVGDFWRINFSRVQWKVDITENGYTKQINPETNRAYPEDNWVWAPTGLINIHYPELWGFVFFSKDGGEYTIPEDEKIKWELRKLYYLQHKFRDENGYFCKDFNVLKSNESYNINPTIETTKNSFEIYCKNSNGDSEISIFSDGSIIVNKP